MASARFAGDARFRDDGDHSQQGQCSRVHAEKNPTEADAADPDLIRWSVQEIRRIATRLARRRIQPAHIIAWSLWRRAHQAAAQAAHHRKSQL